MFGEVLEDNLLDPSDEAPMMEARLKGRALFMRYGHFDEKELASKDGKPSPFPHVVQDELLELLNYLRERWGRPIVVNSAYRSPEHNKAVGGVSNSFHTQGLAADIRPLKGESMTMFRALCDACNPFGGVGLYDTFVHVDCRGTRARWDERTK